MLFLRPVMDEQFGLRALEKVPVVLIYLHRDDPGSRQVIRKTWPQEIHEISETGVVADDHQAVEAIVLRHNDVEDLVE